ncbi:transcription factor Adf-1-like [Planococcus citri]|uniref:transcription factor Adf-1-like n=1 Tax=Planococcus citri TaxID=170843 RepID=UPI0031FA4796
MTSYDEKLITVVSQHPVLYNHMRSDYKSTEIKAEAWEAVRQCLDTNEPVEKIRQRWKSIRDSYVKFLNKLEKAGNGLRIKPYKFEKHLKFLDPFICQPKDGSQMLFDSDDTQIESPDQVLSVSHIKMEEETTTGNSRKRKCKENSSYYALDNGYASMNQDYRMYPQMDDLDLFFLSISQTMKKLKPLTVAKLKKQISNLATDAEIRELEEVDQYAMLGDQYN